jgi:beta-xylosidase
MKKITILSLLLFATISQFVNAQSPVALGDPFIMLHEGIYYAYGTVADDGIAVFVSNDLKTWTVPERAKNGLALHKSDVWADRWFWAPEVYFVNNRFYMYYSADEHICVATAHSPLGPFKQEEKKPMIEDEKCIDNSLFIDDDGKPYLLFDRFNDGLNIWIAELESDLMTIKMETMKKCIAVSQPWEEVQARVNEGSFIVKRNGIYYLSYSANHYKSQFYGIGFATAKNVMGPYKKYEGNPIYQKPKNLVGVGHSSMFTDKNGQLRIVFHAHNSSTEIHPRLMYISSVGFKNGNEMEVMFIDPDFITPQMAEF